jgi:hypothetical protein
MSMQAKRREAIVSANISSKDAHDTSVALS